MSFQTTNRGRGYPFVRGQAHFCLRNRRHYLFCGRGRDAPGVVYLRGGAASGKGCSGGGFGRETKVRSKVKVLRVTAQTINDNTGVGTVPYAKVTDVVALAKNHVTDGVKLKTENASREVVSTRGGKSD